MAEPGKRIAVHMHTLYNGGVERVMINLMQGFLDRGMKVELVVDFLDYSPFEKLLPEGTEVVRLGAYGFRQRLPRLMKYMKDRRPDAMLSATHFANEIACLAKRLTGVKTRLVLSEHTTLSADMADAGPWSHRRLQPWTTKHIYPLADAIVAVSNGVAEDMCRVSGLDRRLVRTIYNPIDFARLRAMAGEALDGPAAGWFEAGEPPVILGIGRMEMQKNFGNMLRAFAILRKDVRARLVILGEGSQHERLKAMVGEMGLGEDVALPGFVANPAAYMARSAVFAMSSAWEGMPVALIEALSLGVPVVSTDCPSGPREILDGGRYGELVAMDDSGALADGLKRVLAGERMEAAEGWVGQFEVGAITEEYLRLLLA
jgi:glycosyltransferase involved in cell wall biosynthesis